MLNKKTIKELQIRTASDCMRGRVDTEKVTDPTDKKLLIATCRRWIKFRLSRNDCQACKESLAATKVVCEYHYHDYRLCDEPYCLPCLLLSSANKAGLKFGGY